MMLGKWDGARINDGSNRPPQLEIHQSMWAMMGLGEEGTELPLDAKLERIAGAGPFRRRGRGRRHTLAGGPRDAERGRGLGRRRHVRGQRGHR